MFDQPAPSGCYRQVVRGRSATLCGDGNPVPVIDSEKPNFKRRLGLCKLGIPFDSLSSRQQQTLS